MNHNKMALPEPSASPWYIILTNVLPWATLYGLTHTAIYYVFKYWSDSRDERLTKIVDEQFEERIKPLENKIDKLTQLFYENVKK